MKKQSNVVIKRCFFIAPIGDKESEIRRRSDRVLNAIVRPVAEKCGYSIYRADEIHNAGSITTQVVDRLIEDDMVIADLTGHNPNVFYELALRHATGKPCVQMIEAGQRVPFDLYDYRTIDIEGFEIEQVESCRAKLEQHILSAEVQENIETPLTRVVRLKNMQASSNYAERSMAEINQALSYITAGISSITEEIRETRPTTTKLSYRYPNLESLVDEISSEITIISEPLVLPGIYFSSENNVLFPSFTETAYNFDPRMDLSVLHATGRDNQLWYIAIVKSLIPKIRNVNTDDYIESIVGTLLNSSRLDEQTEGAEIKYWVITMGSLISKTRERFLEEGLFCSTLSDWLKIQRRLRLTRSSDDSFSVIKH